MVVQNQSNNPFHHWLAESIFFAALDASQRSSLAAAARLLHYQPGETIFWEGEASIGLFWLFAGTLKAVKYSTAGREQILHMVAAGNTFNEVGAFSTLPNPATVVALEAAQVWHIPGDAIRQLIREEPAFAQSVIDILSQRLRHSVTLIEDLSLRSVNSRLARLILDEAKEGVLNRPVWYTQNELAARLGTVADVINRSLRKLESDQLIEVSRQHIKVVDQAALEKLAA